MDSPSTVVDCGFVQILFVFFFLLFEIFCNNVTCNYKETFNQEYQDYRGSHFQRTAKAFPLIHVVKKKIETWQKLKPRLFFQKMATLRSILISVALISLASQVSSNKDYPDETTIPSSLNRILY